MNKDHSQDMQAVHSSVIWDGWPIPDSESQIKLIQLYQAQSKLNVIKNKRYGNAALEPLGVFSRHIKTENSEALNGILVRLDDKLKRVKHGDEIRKNDVSDLMGYLALLCVEKGWTNFDDLID